MVSQTLGVCATCDKPATMRCAGCKDAPDYLPGDALDTFYCDRDCQIKTRETHKNRCRNLSQRIALLRAAKILKTALLTYREMVYDLNLTHIESKDGILRLHQIPKTRPYPFIPRRAVRTARCNTGGVMARARQLQGGTAWCCTARWTTGLLLLDYLLRDNYYTIGPWA